MRSGIAWALVAIVGVGIIAGLTIWMIAANQSTDATGNETESAERQSTQLLCEAIADAVQRFRQDTGSMPVPLDGQLTDPGIHGWRGPYMSGDSMPRDAWGGALGFRHLDNGAFQVFSAGPDGQLGTSDDVNADG